MGMPFDHAERSLVSERSEQRVAFNDRRASVKRAYMVITILFTALISSMVTYLLTKRADSDKYLAAVNNLSESLHREIKQIESKPVATSGSKSEVMLRRVRDSVVVLHSLAKGSGIANYGSAVYLGHGYFLTVKHIVYDMSQEASATKFAKLSATIDNREFPLIEVDSGETNHEVEMGDWSIVRAKQFMNLPPIRVDLSYPFDFAEPFFRVGNDYDKGITPSSGMFGPPQPNGLIAALTDGHPGVSGEQ